MLQRSVNLFASSPWIQRQATDPYVQRAAKEGFIARSAFKLLQIDDKFRLFDKSKTRQVVIDLGAAPGGWSQAVRRRCATDTLLIGVDRSPLATSFVGYRFIQGDFTDPEVLAKLNDALHQQRVSGAVDVIVSDMCPNRSGNSSDRFALAELNSKVLQFARRELKVGGHLVMKMLGGPAYFTKVLESANRHFSEVKVFKPDSSRATSDESFAVAVSRLAKAREGPIVASRASGSTSRKKHHDIRFVRHDLDSWPGLTKFKMRGLHQKRF